MMFSAMRSMGVVGQAGRSTWELVRPGGPRCRIRARRRRYAGRRREQAVAGLVAEGVVHFLKRSRSMYSTATLRGAVGLHQHLAEPVVGAAGGWAGR